MLSGHDIPRIWNKSTVETGIVVFENTPGVFHVKIYAMLQFFCYLLKPLEAKIFIIVIKEQEKRLGNPMTIGSSQRYYL